MGGLTTIDILLLAGFIVEVGLAIFVVTQNPKNALNINFFVMTSLAGLWTISNFIFYVAEDQYRYSIGLLSYSIAALLATWFYIFSATLAKKSYKTVWSRLVVSLGIVASILSAVPGLVAVGINQDESIQTNHFGLAIYGIVLVSLFFSSIYVLVCSLKHSKPNLRIQITTVMLGLAVAAIFGLIFNLLLPVLNNYSYTQLGPLGSLFFVAMSAYGIIKHGLFDIKLAVIRTVAYLFSIATLGVIYFGFAYIASATVFADSASQNMSFNPLNIFLALVLALLFQPVKKFFDHFTNKIFFRSRYTIDEFFARLSGVLTTTTELHHLLQGAAKEIGETLNSKQAFFILCYEESRHVTAGTRNHSTLPAKDLADVIDYVSKNGDDIIVADLIKENIHLRRIMKSHSIELLMPLHHDKTGDLGFLALGEHRTTGYTTRDLKLLHTASDELVIAIQYAMSVQEVREINKNLEQRVHSATEKLRTSNARLKRLDAAKDEFLSIASHQLRTPLTSIKGYLSMVIEGDLGDVTPTQKKVLEEAFSSSERMVNLIHDFLNVSRLQTGKFVLEKHPTDLVALVSAEVESLRRVASSREMELSYTHDVSEKVLCLDDTKLRQVVMNYIDNAIYYSHTNATIHIDLTTSAKAITVTVKDAGIGVPKLERERLFEKFYRASNARKQRPDGTGVGLFLSKKVVDAHGGTIIFESTEGKGSTFGFSLPLEEATLNKDADNADDDKHQSKKNTKRN